MKCVDRLMGGRTYLNLSLFFCLVSSGLAQDQLLQLPNRATFRTDRILAKPKPGLEVSSFSEINASGGDRLIQRFTSLGDLQVIQLRPGRKVSEAVAQYQRSGLFEYVQPDFIYELAAKPNDPKFGEYGTWGLHSTSLDRDIDAPEAWDIRHSAPNVIVAVIDTGIRHTHEDLAGNMWVNSGEIPGNGIDDDQNGYVDDVHGIDAVKNNGDSGDGHGHGTHVAGTIGAVGNNGIGVVGVAWKVQLMACNFFSSDGQGSDSDAIQCIEYARQQGAQVINASWGSFGNSPALHDAIAAAGREGILFVAAAGNSAYSLDLAAYYPASFDLDNVVSVAASDATDRLAIFSNRGQGRIHLAAPGDEILSTWFESDSSYKTLSGTSMAAPHVSGALSLMRAQFPQDSHAQLTNRLLASVDRIEIMKGTSATGGRLNLANALRSASTRPANDAFDRRYPVSNRDLCFDFHHVLLTVSNVDATKESGEPEGPATASGKTVWWSWTAPVTGMKTLSTRGSSFDTFLAIYAGSSLQDLVEVASNDNDPDGGNTSRVSFQAQEGTTYSIAVDGSQGESGRIVLAAPPHNDNFSRRRLIIAPSGDIGPYWTQVALADGTPNLNATNEPGEPQHGDRASERSVWWEWASESGILTVSTSGSSFDTHVAAYSGSDLSSLKLLASNDDSAQGDKGSSQISFDVRLRERYPIAIDGKNGAAGNVYIAFYFHRAPRNDEFTAATESARFLDGSYQTRLTGTNAASSKEPGEPDHAGHRGGRSVWWKWTATRSGDATITTEGSDFNTVLAVYTGGSINQLQLVGANDDDPLGGKTSRVTFRALAGMTYMIAADGYNGASGNIVLNLPPWNNFFSDASLVTGPVLESRYIGISTNGTASKEPGEPNHASNAGGKSVWWVWTAPYSCTITLSTAGSNFDTLLAVYTGQSISSLTQVAANDNDPIGGAASWLRFAAKSGVRYYIAVDGFNGASGNISLSGSYTTVVRDLGVRAFPSGTNIGKAINNNNQVVGWAHDQAGYWDNTVGRKAFFWDPVAGTQMLGALGGRGSIAEDINDKGQVVGWAETANKEDHAFLWQDGNMSDLGTLPSGTHSRALGINQSGIVVGMCTDSTGNAHACMWDAGQAKDLGTLGGSKGQARAINAQGAIIGWSELADGTEHAFLWKDGTMSDLGTLPGGNRSQAWALNDAGIVVGRATAPDGRWHAFAWKDGVMTDLGTAHREESAAFGINNRGDIVGQVTILGAPRPFLWNPNGMQLLAEDVYYSNFSTWAAALSQAFDINESRLISGSGELWPSTIAVVSHAPPQTAPPSVAITEPLPGSTFWAESGLVPIRFSVTAEDPDSEIKTLSLYRDLASEPTRKFNAARFSTIVDLDGDTNTEWQAEATDCQGAVQLSAAVPIRLSTLPRPWLRESVGSQPQRFFSIREDEQGNFDIGGGGTPIGGTADEFNFLHQSWKGDGEVVTFLDNPSLTSFGRVGVMIRQDLSPGSPHAFLAFAPVGSLYFQRRKESGIESLETRTQTAALSLWLRLVRHGSEFKAFASSNGSDWNLIGTETISMPETVFFGVAGNESFTARNVAVFPVEQPRISSPALGAALEAAGPITVSAAFGEERNVARVEFLANGAAIGEARSSPWQVGWTASAAGIYRISARAYDAEGRVAASAPVDFTLVNSPGQVSTWILPASASVGGANGTYWTTDLTIANAGHAATEVKLEFMGNALDGRHGLAKVLAVSAGQTLALRNVLQSAFQLGSGFGAIRISSSSPALAIHARTSTPGGNGSFGQSVPAFEASRWITRGRRASIAGVRENSQFRANLVLANATETPVKVGVLFFSHNGIKTGPQVISLPPLGMVQINNVLSALGVESVSEPGRLELSTQEGEFAAYATVIDNVTGDPRTLLPEFGGSQNWLLPSSADTYGLYGTRWTTNLVLSNSGPQRLAAVLRYLRPQHPVQDPGMAIVYIEPFVTVQLSNVLKSVFGERNQLAFGGIHIDSHPDLIVSSETATPGAGGTFGQSVPAFPESSWITEGITRTLAGVVDTANIRTNLVLSNPLDRTVAVDVNLTAQNGQAIQSRRYLLKAFTMTQIESVVISLAGYRDVGEARLVLSTSTPGGVFAAYATRIDNATGDPRTLLPQ